MPSVDATYLDTSQLRVLEERLRPIVRPLVPLLADPRRVVRAETARVLARLPSPLLASMLNASQRDDLDRAIDEYIVGILETNERGGSHMELGVLYETLGRTEKACDAYRTAIRVEPGLTGPRSNLAALLDRTTEIEQQRLHQQLNRRDMRPDAQVRARAIARVEEESQEREAEASRLRREELTLLERDVNLVPENAALQYRYGLSLHLHKRPEQARKALEKACELEPDNDQFLFALALFYDHYKQYDKALDCISRALRLRPGSPNYEHVRNELRTKVAEARNEKSQSEQPNSSQ
jgi:tetratricopeptide (TPR) repeat protein